MSILLHKLGKKLSPEETTVSRNARVLLSGFSLLSLSVQCFSSARLAGQQVSLFRHCGVVLCGVSQAESSACSLLEGGEMGLATAKGLEAKEAEGLAEESARWESLSRRTAGSLLLPLGVGCTLLVGEWFRCERPGRALRLASSARRVWSDGAGWVVCARRSAGNGMTFT